MGQRVNPRHPVFIPSKGRHDSRLTMRRLDTMGVPYRVVVEAQEFDAYAAVINPRQLVVLDPAYQRSYDACMELEPGQSRGSGPARNMIWDMTESEGAPWHWVVDDNIGEFYRLHENTKHPVADGLIFRAMEDFADRYSNLAMAGPQYEMFVPRRQGAPPFKLNTRVFSCNLIRTDLPFRWRGRYNEDLDLSLRLLKAGYCTVLFNAFLQHKTRTQLVKGGNTDAFYAAEGTLPKSRMIARLHPDCCTVVWKFGRWHHHADFRQFEGLKLVRRPDQGTEKYSEKYSMTLRERDAATA